MQALIGFVLVLGLSALAQPVPVSKGGAGDQSCRHGDRGRLLRVERIASYPTASDARAYYDAWIDFYLGFYVFQPLPDLFDMQHYWDDVLAAHPPTARALLRPAYYEHVRNNPDDPLRARLRQNAVDRWRPRAPIFVYHSRDDEAVFFEDAMVSVERLRSRGGDITVTTFDGLDHINS
jgi:hypothetical protein